MSVEVQWYIEPRVILVNGGESLIAEDTRKIDEGVVALLNQSAEAPIHLLLEGSLVERLPGLMILKKWQWPKHRTLGYVVIFGLKDTPLRMVSGVIARLFGLKFLFHESFDKAIKALRKLDNTLPARSNSRKPEKKVIPTKPLGKSKISRKVSEQMIRVFNGRCEYCLTPQDETTKLKVTEILPEGKIIFENLCFACDSCREARQYLHEKNLELFHPRHDHWSEHFRWTPDGLEIVPLTPKGERTVAHLRLNSEGRKNRRRQGLHEGWHSPDLVRTQLYQDDYFPEGGKLRLEIRDAITAQMVKLVVQPNHVIIFGRSDPEDTLQPDINLGPYGGYRSGVSHIHARINPPVSNALTINDMGSTNGTFVNDEPVDLNKARRLGDGDEIRMGNMVMRVYFEK